MLLKSRINQEQVALTINAASKPLSTREISQASGLSLQNTRNILKAFLKKGIVKREYQDTCRISGRPNVWFYLSDNIYDNFTF